MSKQTTKTDPSKHIEENATTLERLKFEWNQAKVERNQARDNLACFSGQPQARPLQSLYNVLRDEADAKRSLVDEEERRLEEEEMSDRGRKLLEGILERKRAQDSARRSSTSSPLVTTRHDDNETSSPQQVLKSVEVDAHSSLSGSRQSHSSSMVPRKRSLGDGAVGVKEEEDSKRSKPAAQGAQPIVRSPSGSPAAQRNEQSKTVPSSLGRPSTAQSPLPTLRSAAGRVMSVSSSMSALVATPPRTIGPSNTPQYKDGINPKWLDITRLGCGTIEDCDRKLTAYRQIDVEKKKMSDQVMSKYRATHPKLDKEKLEASAQEFVKKWQSTIKEYAELQYKMNKYKAGYDAMHTLLEEVKKEEEN